MFKGGMHAASLFLSRPIFAKIYFIWQLFRWPLVSGWPPRFRPGGLAPQPVGIFDFNPTRGCDGSPCTVLPAMRVLRPAMTSNFDCAPPAFVPGQTKSLTPGSHPPPLRSSAAFRSTMSRSSTSLRWRRLCRANGRRFREWSHDRRSLPAHASCSPGHPAP